MARNPNEPEVPLERVSHVAEFIQVSATRGAYRFARQKEKPA
jgi:hypothetical protein